MVTEISGGVPIKEYVIQPGDYVDAVGLYDVDLTTWDDGVWVDTTLSEAIPEHIDDPWPYRFHEGDKVLFRNHDGHWYPGTVIGSQPKQGRTQSGTVGLWWWVQFIAPRSRVRCRTWYAPLNGEVKPDDAITEALLEKAWLEDIHGLSDPDVESAAS